MKYHKHEIIKVKDDDLEWGYFYNIYKDGKYITNACILSSAKEFVDTYDEKTGSYNYKVLC